MAERHSNMHAALARRIAQDVKSRSVCAFHYMVAGRCCAVACVSALSHTTPAAQHREEANRQRAWLRIIACGARAAALHHAIVTDRVARKLDPTALATKLRLQHAFRRVGQHTPPPLLWLQMVSSSLQPACCLFACLFSLFAVSKCSVCFAPLRPCNAGSDCVCCVGFAHGPTMPPMCCKTSFGTCTRRLASLSPSRTFGSASWLSKHGGLDGTVLLTVLSPLPQLPRTPLTHRHFPHLQHQHCTRSAPRDSLAMAARDSIVAKRARAYSVSTCSAVSQATTKVHRQAATLWRALSQVRPTVLYTTS